MPWMHRLLVLGVMVSLSWGGRGIAFAEDAAKPQAETPQAAQPSATAAPAAAPSDNQPLSVQNEMEVAMQYTLTSDGVVVDSNEGKDPLRYVQGHQQIIPGLEQALQGLHVGDTKEVTVKPEEGYGSVDPAKVVEVPKEKLPADVTPTVGMVLRGVNPEGHPFPATIKEVREKTVLLDLNHPLAGKTLNFKVKITGITPAKSKS